MAKTGKINVDGGDLLNAFRGFFKAILDEGEIDALLVPQQLPMKPMVMPTLVVDSQRLDAADPLAPAFPMNAAKLASRLTRREIGRKVAVVLRPCEIRAFVELVKLKQARMDELLIVGVDCLGALRNSDYAEIVGTDPAETTRRFYSATLSGNGSAFEGKHLSAACRVCELPIPAGADILIGLYGVDTEHELMVQAQTEKGERLFDRLDISIAEEPPARQKAVRALLDARTDLRDAMIADTAAETDSLEKLTAYLGACVNCYNCRVACPVCYCKECVFVTDVFDHEPAQYLRWAGRKGLIKMPTDTVFYHLTRLAHMSTACVGCGQCSNACPNDIPVMELFRAVAHKTQAAFDYEAGRSVEEAPPLSEFRENEFTEVVGIDT